MNDINTPGNNSLPAQNQNTNQTPNAINIPGIYPTPREFIVGSELALEKSRRNRTKSSLLTLVIIVAVVGAIAAGLILMHAVNLAGLKQYL